MGRNLAKIVLGLALVGILLPTTGCKVKKGGSYTDVFIGFDWLPSFGGYDFYDDYDEHVYYEEDVIIVEETYDDYYDDGYYYEDEYWDDDEYDLWGYWDDDWKKKRPEGRP